MIKMEKNGRKIGVKNEDKPMKKNGGKIMKKNQIKNEDKKRQK